MMNKRKHFVNIPTWPKDKLWVRTITLLFEIIDNILFQLLFSTIYGKRNTFKPQTKGKTKDKI
jgi:hypothetical protein